MFFKDWGFERILLKEFELPRIFLQQSLGLELTVMEKDSGNQISLLETIVSEVCFDESWSLVIKIRYEPSSNAVVIITVLTRVTSHT